MILSEEKKFVFFHIPKTAGSSLRKILTPYASEFLFTYDRKLGHPYHIKQSYIREQLNGINLEEYFEFVVVRDPLERLISMFNHGRREQFGEFYKFALHVSRCYVNPETNHFYHSQLDWLKNPLTNNINVYRFENITEQMSTHESVGVYEFTMSDMTDKEMNFCMDFLSEEYEYLKYDRK